MLISCLKKIINYTLLNLLIVIPTFEYANAKTNLKSNNLGLINPT